MNKLKSLLKLIAVLGLIGTIAGCCVVPVEPGPPRLYGRVVVEPAPVIVAPWYRHGWRR